MKLLYLGASMLLPFLISPGAQARDVQVRGYTTKKGRYVAPTHRTAPNGTKRDNYSAQGQVNPWTGKAGTKAVQDGAK